MREIKFRAKVMDKGVWAYGMPLPTKFGCGYMLDIKASAYGADFYFSRFTMPFGTAFAIDMETVGQYTGLKDKDDNEIYEGDIIEFWQWLDEEYGTFTFRNQRGKIVSHDGCFWCENNMYTQSMHEVCLSNDYLGFGKDDEMPCDSRGVRLTWDMFGIKIIGNIYDNKDLLEE